MHKKDLPKGTLHEIIKQSGMTIEEFSWLCKLLLLIPYKSSNQIRKKIAILQTGRSHGTN